LGPCTDMCIPAPYPNHAHYLCHAGRAAPCPRHLASSPPPRLPSIPTTPTPLPTTAPTFTTHTYHGRLGLQADYRRFWFTHCHTPPHTHTHTLHTHHTHATHTHHTHVPAPSATFSHTPHTYRRDPPPLLHHRTFPPVRFACLAHISCCLCTIFSCTPADSHPRLHTLSPPLFRVCTLPQHLHTHRTYPFHTCLCNTCLPSCHLHLNCLLAPTHATRLRITPTHTLPASHTSILHTCTAAPLPHTLRPHHHYPHCHTHLPLPPSTCLPLPACHHTVPAFALPFTFFCKPTTPGQDLASWLTHPPRTTSHSP